MNLLETYKQYQILFLISGFTVFVVAWFIWKSPDKEAAWTPAPAQAVASQADEEFQPDGSNVSPTTQNQLESLRMRIVKAPDDTTHIFRFARLLQDAHQSEEAARNYRHYLALHPENYQAWLDMTQSFGQAQLWDDALEAVNDMLERYPDDASALYNRGAVFANLGQFEKARSSFQKVIDQKKNPEVAALAESMIKRLSVE